MTPMTSDRIRRELGVEKELAQWRDSYNKVLQKYKTVNSQIFEVYKNILSTGIDKEPAFQKAQEYTNYFYERCYMKKNYIQTLTDALKECEENIKALERMFR